MSKNRVIIFATIISVTISIVTLIISTSSGWGNLQARVTSVEAKEITQDQMFDKKVDKELYNAQQQQIMEDLRTIKQDVKVLLQRSK